MMMGLMMGFDWRKLIGLMVSFVVGAVICCIMNLIGCSCTRTLYVPVETVRHDSVWMAKVAVDTVMVKDSVYVAEKGDTVYYSRWKTEYRYRYVTDTCYVERTDSVQVPYEVVKVEKERYVPEIVYWIIGMLSFGLIGILVWYKIKNVL